MNRAQAQADEVAILTKAIHGETISGVFEELRAHHFAGPFDGVLPAGAHALIWAYAEDLRTGGVANPTEMVRAISNDAARCGPVAFWRPAMMMLNAALTPSSPAGLAASLPGTPRWTTCWAR